MAIRNRSDVTKRKNGMLTCSQIRQSVNGSVMRTVPFGIGNTMFMIASTIGIAEMNGYRYGFDNFLSAQYFENPLPKTSNKRFSKIYIPKNYKGADLGFYGWDIPDNSDIVGYMGSWKYFDHCRDLIRHYFTFKKLCEPIKDAILISYRDYDREGASPVFRRLDYKYFQDALAILPSKPVYVISDNPARAKEVIREEFTYIQNSPIVDLYLLSNADYLIMSPSTFSWWGAYLSGAVTIAPHPWFVGEWSDCPINFNDDLYLKQWRTL